MLGISVGKWVIIALVVVCVFVGIGAYVKYTMNTIQNLTTQVTAYKTQADDLKATNAAMQQDIKNIQSVQADLNKNLQTIRVQSAQTAQTIRNRVLNTTNPAALQTQINNDTATAFKALQDLSK